MELATAEEAEGLARAVDVREGLEDVGGHIVLERSIAERGRYPPVNVLRSISRTMPQCNSAEENELVTRAKTAISTYENMEELIRLGAYRKGSDASVDEAMLIYPDLEKFMAQDKADRSEFAAGYSHLAEILAAVAGGGSSA